MSKRSESGDRQLWNLANHEDRRTPRGRSGPYDCKEILEWLAAHPERDNPLIRWYIETQRNPRCGRDDPPQ